jgi:hypothetical protein
MNRVTRNDPRDAWLAAALDARAEDGQPRNDCPLPERIWDAVHLQLSRDERLQVIDHLAECPTCAEAWRLAAGIEKALEPTAEPVMNAFQLPVAATAAPSPPVSALYGRRAPLIGTAAVLLLALGIAFIVLRPAAPPREATESPLTPPSTPAPQPVQQTTNPVAAPAPVRPSPPAPAGPAVVETPSVAAAQDRLARAQDELARARGQIPAAQRAPRAATAPLSPVESDESAIRRVIATYKTSIETRDVDLFRSVRPGLSPAEEARLRASFRQIDAQQVTITIEDIQVDGTTAMARISRQDAIIINGEQRQVASSRQVLRFEKSASGWFLTAIEALR